MNFVLIQGTCKILAGVREVKFNYTKQYRKERILAVIDFPQSKHFSSEMSYLKVNDLEENKAIFE